MSGLYRTTRIGNKRTRTGSFSNVSGMSSSAVPLSSAYGTDSGMSFISQARKYERKKPPLRYKGRDKRVAKIARVVAARLVDKEIEVKYLNVSISGASIGQSHTTAGPSTASGHYGLALVYPGTGSGSAQAIGDKIKLKYLNVSIKVQGQASFNNPKELKFVLCRFKAPAPSANVGQLVLPNGPIDVANGGTGAGSVVAIYDCSSLRNTDQAEQVEVLYEKTLFVGTHPNGGSGGVKSTFNAFELSIPMYNRPMEQASGAVINYLYQIYMFSDSGERGAVAPTISGLSEYSANSGMSMQIQYIMAYQDA